MVVAMAYRDTEVDSVLHVPEAASLPAPPDWRRLYEQALERAEAAERCGYGSPLVGGALEGNRHFEQQHVAGAGGMELPDPIGARDALAPVAEHVLFAVLVESRALRRELEAEVASSA